MFKRKNPAVEMSPEELKAEIIKTQADILKVCDCRTMLNLYRGQLFRLQQAKAPRRQINAVFEKINLWEKRFTEYQRLTSHYAELNKMLAELNGEEIPEVKPYPAPPVKPVIKERIINLKYRVKMSDQMRKEGLTV